MSYRLWPLRKNRGGRGNKPHVSRRALSMIGGFVGLGARLNRCRSSGIQFALGCGTERVQLEPHYRSFRFFPLVAACVVAFGCGAQHSAVAIAANVRVHPDAVVCALVDITVDGTADSVVVESGTTTGYSDRTSSMPLQEGTATVPVFGLAPSALNHFRVDAYSAGGLVAQSGDLTFATPALPTGFPTLAITTPAAQTDGYILMDAIPAMNATGPATAYALIVDRAGRNMWYRQTILSAQGLATVALSNGHIALFNQSPGQFQTGGFEEVDLLGNVVHAWFDPASEDGVDGFDILSLPNGNSLMLGIQPRMADLSSIYPGSTALQLMIDFNVDEVDASGGNHFHWSTNPNISLAESTGSQGLAVAQGNALDFYHPNSLALDTDGNYLVSLRYTDSVLKLDKQTGATLWRLGGNLTQFVISDDPLGAFNHQHSIQMLPNGHLLLFDGGNLHNPPQSRVVEYALDEANLTAALYWSVNVPLNESAGSVQRLPSGDTLIGLDQEIREVDASGAVTWDASLDFVIFRAAYLPSL